MKIEHKCPQCEGCGMVGLDTEIDYRVCPKCGGGGKSNGKRLLQLRLILDKHNVD